MKQKTLMKRIWIATAAVVMALPLEGLAKTPQHHFFETALAPRLQQCKSHYDIQPYLVLAVGGDPDGGITPSVKASLDHYVKTGQLLIPVEKQKDAVALNCATYAEGLLAGGLGAQLIDAIGDETAKTMTDAIKQIGDGIGEAIRNGLDQANGNSAKQ